MYGKLNISEWPDIGPWAELRELSIAIERLGAVSAEYKYRIIVEKSVLAVSDEPVHRITLVRWADPRVPKFWGDEKTVLGVYTDVHEVLPILKLLYSNLDEEQKAFWEKVAAPSSLIPQPPWPKPPKPRKPKP